MQAWVGGQGSLFAAARPNSGCNTFDAAFLAVPRGPPCFLRSGRLVVCAKFRTSSPTTRSRRVWSSFTTQVGDPGEDLRLLGALPGNVLAVACEEAEVSGEQLSVIHATQVRLVWRLASRILHVQGARARGNNNMFKAGNQDFLEQGNLAPRASARSEEGEDGQRPGSGGRHRVHRRRPEQDGRLGSEAHPLNGGSRWQRWRGGLSA